MRVERVQCRPMSADPVLVATAVEYAYHRSVALRGASVTVDRAKSLL